jgi:hypothetical protein
MFRVLSLGAGVQSTTLLLMSLRGELPRLDAAIFADTQWEPKKVYAHLEWLKELCAAAGLPLYSDTAGNLRQDAIDFRRIWKSAEDGKKKRHASIPAFVRNDDGSQGRVKRQCTKEYKIEVVDRILRRVIMGLKPRQHAPKLPTVEHWFGITSDESKRAVYPGRYAAKPVATQPDFWGGSTAITRQVWQPTLWEIHAYPFLDVALWPDRTCHNLGWLEKADGLRTYSRDDCLDWLAEHYPDHPVPRSACIGCPFRDNASWRRMRDEEPEEWADAVAFDRSLRLADSEAKANGAGQRLTCTPYIHRQMIPLDMVDLGGDGEKEGTNCGAAGDGFDGMCGI